MADMLIDAELILLFEMWQQCLDKDRLLTHLCTKFQKDGDKEQKLNAEWWKDKMGGGEMGGVYTECLKSTWHCSYLYLW